MTAENLVDKARDWIANHLPATLALVVGLVVSVVGFTASHNYFQVAAGLEFEKQAQHYILVIRSNLDRHRAVLDQAAELFSKPVMPDRWQFFEYTKTELQSYPGIRALAWVPRVTAAERTDYEDRAVADGLQRFSFSSPGSGSAPLQAAVGDEHFPIYYIEPTEGNEEYLGVDLNADAALRDVLLAAGKSGETAAIDATPAFGLAPQWQLLLVRPVLRRQDLVGSQAGTRELAGFVVAVLKMREIVDTVLSGFTTPAWLDVYMYDGLPGQEGAMQYYRPSSLRPLYEGPAPDREIFSGLHLASPYRIGAREVSLVVRAVPGKYGQQTTTIPYAVGIFGLLMTSFLVFYLVTSKNRARIIEQTVADRTAQLSSTNRSLEREIDERRRVEVELRRAKDQADVANHAKSQFLAMVSHELRTPLNAIIGFSEVITGEVFGPIGNPRYAEYIRDIQSSGSHLLELINNILDLTKVEANEFNFNDQPIDLGQVMNEATRTVHERLTAAGLELDFNVPPDLPLLRADSRSVRQILLNLLSNAMKFTAEGGRVTVEAGLDDDGCPWLAVTDTGIGIVAKNIERVFEPFFQVDSSLSREYEGTGLGLALTRSLIKMHGGDIRLESKPGKGTRAVVRFPAERVVAQQYKIGARGS